MEKISFLKIKDHSKLPKETGVYVFKKGKEILYIGKATNIRERVRSHLKKTSFGDNFFVDKAKEIGFIITNSEIEALILESQLIKKYQPKHNILWKDDKNYFYLGVTKEEFPRVFITHQPKEKNTIFIGPFVEGKALKESLQALRKVFPFRSCKKIPKYPCIWYQLNRCPAPCLIHSMPELKEKIKKEAKENIEKLISFFSGKKEEILESLRKEMERSAKKEDFERAAQIRDKIFALEKILSHTRIFQEQKETEESFEKIEKELQKITKTKKKIERIEGYDISNIQGKEATASMVVFIKGNPSKKDYRKFKIKQEGKPNDFLMLQETIERRLKHTEWPFPDLIFIDGGKGQLSACLKILKKHKIEIPVISFAKRGEKIYTSSSEKAIPLKKLLPQTQRFILQIKDEAHRFAISYHRLLRKKKFLE